MNYKQLTENERYQIYMLKKAGHNQKVIAGLLGRSASTICRELRHNQGFRGYRAGHAQRLSDTCRQEARKARKLTPEVRGWIERRIPQELIPQQVVDYLKRHKKLSLHHETVYQLIYEDKATDGDLYNHLFIASKPYRKRCKHYERRKKIVNRVDIDERPAIAERRSRIGDWEGDTIMGKGHKGELLTLVERKTLYTIIHLTGKRSGLLAEAAVQGKQALKSKVKTIIFDNGLEFSNHETIGEGLEAAI